MDASAGHVAERTLVVLRCGRAAGPEPSDAVREPACRREQEVPGTARGIDDGEVQQCIDGTLGVGVDRAVDNRIERAAQENLNEFVRRVVATGGLPCMANALVRAREGERSGRSR